jgi:FkbM family methyltransferase
MEVLLARIYRSVVKRGDCVIDGGACGGLHTRPLARLVGNTGRVFAYEPNALDRLAEQMKAEGLADRVTYRQVGLGNVSGSGKFYRNISESARSSRMRPRDMAGHVEESIEMVRLDDEPIEGRLSFIKLDIEGGEFDCLHGADALLRAHSPVIVFENGRAWPATQFGYTMEEFFEFFRERRYHLADIFGRSLDPASWRDRSLAWYFVASTDLSDLREVEAIASRLVGELGGKGINLNEWADVVKSVDRFGELPS